MYASSTNTYPVPAWAWIQLLLESSASDTDAHHSPVHISQSKTLHFVLLMTFKDCLHHEDFSGGTRPPLTAERGRSLRPLSPDPVVWLFDIHISNTPQTTWLLLKNLPPSYTSFHLAQFLKAVSSSDLPLLAYWSRKPIFPICF